MIQWSFFSFNLAIKILDGRWQRTAYTAQPGSLNAGLDMEIALIGFAGIVGFVLILSFIAPNRVTFTEEITIHAPVAQVYDDIRLQDHLMRRSAWPRDTRPTCAVEGTVGEAGACTVFCTKGKHVGHHDVVGLVANTEIALTLVCPGPPHRPRLTFALQPVGPDQTIVRAHFVNELTRPFNIIWKFAGLSRWTRNMHRKDLQGLRAFAEPPHRDINGTVVGRPPTGQNPYQHQTISA